MSDLVTNSPLDMESVTEMLYDNRQKLDSIQFAISEITKNTEPNIQNLSVTHVSLIALFIAFISLVIGIIAVKYNKKTFRAQVNAVKRLDIIVPGLLSFRGIINQIMSNIITLEAIYFGKLDPKTLQIKLILTRTKMPIDFIQLEKYEKNQLCVDEAYKLREAWLSYNDAIDSLISVTMNEDRNSIMIVAQQLIEQSKIEISRIQRFYKTLYYQKLLPEKIATKEKLSFYIIDRFCDSLNSISKYRNRIKDLDTSRLNLNGATIGWIINAPYFPVEIDMKKYENEQLENNTSIYDDDYVSDNKLNRLEIINKLSRGEFDFLNNYMFLPEGTNLSDIDFRDFHACYFNYIEPILVGYKRIELETYLMR